MVEDILNKILEWIIGLLRDTTLGLVESAIASGLLVLPSWVTNAAEVINGRFRVLVITCYALVVCIGALMVMGSDNIQFTYSAREIIPRLVAGFALAVMSWSIVASLANINNAVVMALVLGDNSEPVPENSEVSTDFLNLLLIAADLGSMLFVELIVAVLKLIAIVMLFLCMLLRNVAWFLVVLLAPVGLASHGLPFTEGAAFLWWRMTFACLASCLGQACVLWVWETLFQGLSSDEVIAQYTFKPFYILVLVWLIWKIHKAAFIWARGTPLRFPGGRLVKGVAKAAVVGWVLKSNPVGKVAGNLPVLRRVTDRLTRSRRDETTSRSSQTATEQAPTRSTKPWRWEGERRDPLAGMRRRPSKKQWRDSSGNSSAGTAAPQKGKKNHPASAGNNGGGAPISATTPNSNRNGQSSQQPPKNPGHPANGKPTNRQAPQRRQPPPDRRPQWPTPPQRREPQQRPKWQPPRRRPSNGKDSQ